MKILVINAGSSSLKYQLFDMDNGNVLARGICEKIGITPESGSITHKRPGCENYEKETPVKGELLNLNLEKGQKARIDGQKKWINDPAKMQLTIPAKEVVVIHIK